jgi:hypothetical protein
MKALLRYKMESPVSGGLGVDQMNLTFKWADVPLEERGKFQKNAMAYMRAKQAEEAAASSSSS